MTSTKHDTVATYDDTDGRAGYLWELRSDGTVTAETYSAYSGAWSGQRYVRHQVEVGDDPQASLEAYVRRCYERHDTPVQESEITAPHARRWRLVPYTGHKVR